MAPFSAAARLVSLVALANHNNSVDKMLLEVCMSPGCVADGARNTLNRLQALSPPELFCVQEGGCTSACGKGPVVQENAKIVHKYVKNDKLLTRMLQEQELVLPKALVEGYDKACLAKEAFDKKQHQEAASLYEEGMKLAKDLVLTTTRQNDTVKIPHSNGIPVHLLWIIQAHVGWARSLLELGKAKAAFNAIQVACDISNHQDGDSLQVLAEVCQARNDAKGEMEALERFLALPVPDDLPMAVANTRRNLGFRLANLQDK